MAKIQHGAAGHRMDFHLFCCCVWVAKQLVLIIVFFILINCYYDSVVNLPFVIKNVNKQKKNS